MTQRFQRSSLRRKKSKGGALVESALIALILFPMMVGIFDFAQFLYIQQAIVERARYAARWGAINDPTNSTAIQNMVLYDQSTAPADGTPTFFNLTASNVSSSVLGLSSGLPTDDYRMVLTVSGYQYTMISPYIFGTYTGPPISITVPLGKFN